MSNFIQQTPAWTVVAWRPQLCQARSAPKLQFTHLGTTVQRSFDTDAPRSGQTVWGLTGADSQTEGPAGVAWDWIEITQGVVAIADPMAMITNLRLIGAHGEVLTAPEAALHLNELVHALPWQDEVQRAMGNAFSPTIH